MKPKEVTEIRWALWGLSILICILLVGAVCVAPNPWVVTALLLTAFHVGVEGGLPL